MQDRKTIADNVYKLIINNDLAGVRQAIEKDPWLLEYRHGFDTTFLHDACWEDRADMAALLISLKADVNARSDVSTPLSQAIFKKASLKTIQILLDAKADVNYRGSYSGPLYWAHCNGQNDVVEALLKAGARARANEVFYSAVMNGEEKLVDILIDHQISVNSTDSEGQSLLTWAACNGSGEEHYRIAQKLLSLKADVNQKDDRGRTPLYWAVTKSSPDLAELYLNHGAKLDTHDYHGITPLMHAAEDGKLPVIQLLAARSSKADLEAKDVDNSTVLHFAAQNWDDDVCPYFIDKGLDCNAVNNKGNTPLHDACDHHKYKNIDALLKAGAKVAIENTDGKTPLDLLKERHSDYDKNFEQCEKTLEALEIKEKTARYIQNESTLKSLVEKFNEHIARCIVIIRSGEKEVVKTLDTALKLLIVGNMLQSQEIIEAALSYIRRLDKKEFLAISNSHFHEYPILVNLAININTMLEKYPQLTFEDVLPQVGLHYLYGNISDHLKKMEAVTEKLHDLTHLTWQFNGANYKSESCYDWHPGEPKHPSIYSNLVSKMLIARGLLSGQFSGVTSFSKDNDRWTCKVVDGDALLKLNSNDLKDEIEKASNLIANITGAPCNFLHIYPVKDASYYNVLEKIGCIKVEEFYAFNAQVIDFDLAKLQQLYDAKISMEEIWNRYKKADGSKPLFEQICKSNNSLLSKLFKTHHIDVLKTAAGREVSPKHPRV